MRSAGGEEKKKKSSLPHCDRLAGFSHRVPLPFGIRSGVMPKRPRENLEELPVSEYHLGRMKNPHLHELLSKLGGQWAGTERLSCVTF